jgi:hypothetical protein
VRGACLDGYLEGTASAPAKTIQVKFSYKTLKMEDNPAYATRYAQDQQVLSFFAEFHNQGTP